MNMASAFKAAGAYSHPFFGAINNITVKKHN